MKESGVDEKSAPSHMVLFICNACRTNGFESISCGRALIYIYFFILFNDKWNHIGRSNSILRHFEKRKLRGNLVEKFAQGHITSK